jgi:hypothetical protein
MQESPQNRRVAVAPHKYIAVSRKGRALILQPGAEVLLDDVVGIVPAKYCREELIKQGVVRYSSDGELSADTGMAANYLSAPEAMVGATLLACLIHIESD